MPVERVKVEIYGESYILKGDASPEYMKMLANYINEKMNYIAEKSSKLPSSKVAILTAINIADELMKLRKENSKIIELLNNGSKSDEKKAGSSDQNKSNSQPFNRAARRK